ncbi:unnamed protein product [Closterium sp. NIES-54]
MATMKLTAGDDVAEQQLGNEEALLILPHGYDPDEEDEPAYCFLAPAPEEPASMEEALAGPNREKWLVSRDAEYQSLLENGTWDLVVLPEGKKAVQCKWVLRITTDDKGQVTIYKSRLVAKGFMQKEKQDFNEIFAPTAKPPTLRVLLADAAVSGKFIIQMDISTAFLNEILEEDVYMTQPPANEDGTGRVCKLKKSIYGLKQAPRCWYQKLAAVLEEMGFRTSSCAESLFLKGEREKLVLFLVYVDDILLFSSSMKEIQKVQQQLMKNFKCKTLGEPGGAEPGGATPGGAKPGGAEPARAGPARAVPGGSPDASQAAGAGGAVGTGGSVAAKGAGATSPGGARTGSTGAAGPAGTPGAGAAAGVGAEAPAVGPGGGPAGGTTGTTGGTGAGAATGAGAFTGGAGAFTGGAGAILAVSGVAARPQPYFVPLLQQVLGLPSSTGPPPPLECPQPVPSQLQLQPASQLPAPSPYTGPTGGLAEHREPASRPASPVRAARTSGRGSRQRPPPSDSLRAASPTVMRLLATVVTDPSFESTAASALVAELVDFAARCRLDYAASLVAESESLCPPSVGGECALGTDVLEDRQEEFQCLAAASPHLVSVLLTPEGDPDALDIPTPRSYAEAIEGPYSSQWQAAMDAEMASWKSTGTYVEEVPPPGANIVSGMWIFRVKRPPGSPPVFKARYVARGFSQRQGVDYFQTFSPTPKMTTLRVLLHIAVQRDYELNSLDFSTAFLQGSLHEEIWLRRPLGFTGTFPPGTQWSLRRPVYGLRQAPREWHDTLRTTLAALGYLGLQITRDRAQRTITLTLSHMVQQVLQRFGFTYSSPQATSLPTRHSLSALPSDESVESSGPYPELVGCLMYLMTCTRPDLAYPLSILARYVAPGRHRPEHMATAKRVLRYLCSTSGMGLVLGGRSLVVLTGLADASWADDQATQRSSQGYTIGLGSGSVSWRATRSSSVLGSSCEAEIYAGAMAAQELRWLTYLLTDFGEVPRFPPVLYVDNKAMLALCREQRLKHRTKHIALRYFLARELQQRGQLRLAYVASEANTADIFTKALAFCNHQHFCT